MELASCTVLLNGDKNMAVVKKDVTPAEVAILRAIHGNESVLDVKPARMDKRAHRAEKARLLSAYGAKRVEETFPGAFPSLPIKFSELHDASPISLEEGDELALAQSDHSAAPIETADAE